MNMLKIALPKEIRCAVKLGNQLPVAMAVDHSRALGHPAVRSQILPFHVIATHEIRSRTHKMDIMPHELHEDVCRQ